MAQIEFSSDALALSVQRAASMRRPYVGIGWWKGQYNNARGEGGEVVWERTQEPRWHVHLENWDAPEGMAIEPRCVQLHGLNVFVDRMAQHAPGTLVVEVLNGELVVRHVDA
jgi:hypothetical protein